MSFSLLNLRPAMGSEEWYSDGFRQLVEDHLNNLKASPESLISPTPQECYMYRGDYHGLLRSKGVETKYIWPTMRVNGLVSSVLYDGEPTIVRIPNKQTLDSLMAAYVTRRARL